MPPCDVILPSVSTAAALSHCCISDVWFSISLQFFNFSDRSWAFAFPLSALEHKLHRRIVIFSLLPHSQGHNCTPSQRQAATVGARLPSSLGAQCQSRAEEEIHLWGSELSCLKEFKRDGWMEKAKGKTPPVLWAERDGRGKGKNISEPDSTEVFVEINFFYYVTEEDRFKLCFCVLILYASLHPTIRPHQWNQVILLLAHFLQPCDATVSNPLYL